MSWKQVAGRGTWLGAAVAALVLLAGLGVAALLLLRGAVPESAMRPLVWIVRRGMLLRRARSGAEGWRWCAAAGTGCIGLRVRRHVAGGADRRGRGAVRAGRYGADLRRVGRRTSGRTGGRPAEKKEACRSPEEKR